VSIAAKRSYSDQRARRCDRPRAAASNDPRLSSATAASVASQRAPLANKGSIRTVPGVLGALQGLGDTRERAIGSESVSRRRVPISLQRSLLSLWRTTRGSNRLRRSSRHPLPVRISRSRPLRIVDAPTRWPRGTHSRRWCSAPRCVERPDPDRALSLSGGHVHPRGASLASHRLALAAAGLATARRGGRRRFATPRGLAMSAVVRDAATTKPVSFSAFGAERANGFDVGQDGS